MNESPASVPLRFFRSVHQKDYAQAWSCLTRTSQELIVRMLTHSWKVQSSEEIAAAFNKGQGVAKTYFEHFRASIQIETWLSQSYGPFGVSGDEVIVKATPSGVTLLVRREGESWKFGYMETFLERG